MSKSLTTISLPIPKKSYIPTLVTVLFLGNCLFLFQTSAASNSHIKNEESASNIIANHKLSSGNAVVKSHMKKKKVVRQVNFLLCENCFWCASQIDALAAISSEQEIREKKLGTPLLQEDGYYCCPVCKTGNIESMPIRTDEIFNLGARKNKESEV
jgi:hypothetical protein